jgi:hypothetical protein
MWLVPSVGLVPIQTTKMALALLWVWLLQDYSQSRVFRRR